jgi:protein SCO1/2
VGDLRRRLVTGLAAAPLLTALALLAGCAGSGSASPVANVRIQDDDGMNGAVLPEPYHVPDATLTATDGTPYALRADTTKPLTLVFFGYTNCPDLCQVVMADIASAVSRLSAADRAKVGMLFITTDPARDDATVLRAYVDRFNPDFTGLTGPLRTITTAGKALGVPIEKGTKLPTGGYDVNHGTQVIGLLPNGTAPIVWTQGTPPGRLADDIATILHKGLPSTSDSGSGS